MKRDMKKKRNKCPQRIGKYGIQRKQNKIKCSTSLYLNLPIFLKGERIQSTENHGIHPNSTKL